MTHRDAYRVLLYRDVNRKWDREVWNSRDAEAPTQTRFGADLAFLVTRTGQPVDPNHQLVDGEWYLTEMTEELASAIAEARAEAAYAESEPVRTNFNDAQHYARFLLQGLQMSEVGGSCAVQHQGKTDPEQFDAGF